MRRPLIDINVLLDVLGEREPFLADAERIWTAAETKQIDGLISADSFSTLYYLLRQASNARTAQRGISLLLSVFEVVELDKQILQQALDSPVKDFEDAIQYHCAVRGKADCIVTRDLRHYRNADLPVMSPDAFLAALDSE
jgi:predicted nucleic acid-binding protein